MDTCYMYDQFLSSPEVNWNCYRYVAQGRYTEAIDLLYSGSLKLLDKNQVIAKTCCPRLSFTNNVAYTCTCKCVVKLTFQCVV